MQIFNIGALELVFILLLAFIILGPKKAVKTAGDIGRWVRDLASSQFWKDLMSTSREIQALPKRLMDDAEIQQTIEELDRATGEMSTSLNQVRREADNELTKINQEIDQDRHIHPDPKEEKDSNQN